MSDLNGSGKTTLFNAEFASDYVRVSQDDQGKDGHLLVFKKAIKENKNIYLDRINHTLEQRSKYLKLAKDAGYQTRIIVLQESYRECRKRIIARPDHPTLKKENADEALSMFIFQYRIPASNEADVVEFRGKDSNYLLNIVDDCKNKRVFIVGDLHGMYDELVSVLEKAEFVPNIDVLIFTGDLVDRGPGIDKCLSWLNSFSNSYSVMGNHEYKFVRYLLGRKIHPNSLAETIEQTKKWDKNSLIPLLMSMPFSIKFRENAYVVHAGINPLKLIHKQFKDELMYTRDITLGEKTAPWWSFYSGQDEIYFGHEVTPEKTQVTEKVFAMDGGACFGMELRLCVNNPDGTKEFFVEKANKCYADYRKDEPENENAVNPLEAFDSKVKERISFQKNI